MSKKQIKMNKRMKLISGIALTLCIALCTFSIYYYWGLTQTKGIMDELQSTIEDEGQSYGGSLGNLNKLHLRIEQEGYSERVDSISQGFTWLWGDRGHITLKGTYEIIQDGDVSYPGFIWYIDLKNTNGVWAMSRVQTTY